MGERGVLLLGMGGPDNLDQVEAYIYSLLSDPDIVRLPLGRWIQKPFARLVSRRRAPRVAERYRLVGSCSPIRKETDAIARALETALSWPVRYALRYTGPTAAEAWRALSLAGVKDAVVLPLFPQYSSVTTAPALREAASCGAPAANMAVIEHYHDDEKVIAAQAALLGRSLDVIDRALETRVIFTAHSVPVSYTRDGDPYVEQIRATARLIEQRTAPGVPCTLAFQSATGPVRWVGPLLGEVLRRLRADGVRQVVVQPLSFVTENLETLYDLDVAFAADCAAAGVRSFHRVPTVGASALYVDALAALAKRAMEERP